MEQIKNGPRILLVLFIMTTRVDLSYQNSGMDLLEPYIRSGIPVSLRADNGKYWSLWGPLPHKVFADKSHKDPWTKFKVTKVNDDTINLQNTANGKYLSLWGPGENIFPRKPSPDQWCNFKVHKVDGKLVLQNTANGKFLARYCCVEGKNAMRADRQHIDTFTKFLVESGSILPVTEEIIDVTWGSTNDFVNNMRPKIVASDTGTNWGSEPLQQDLSVSWALTESSETSWEHGWGITAGIKFTKNFSPIPIGFGSSLELSLELNYNGKKAGNEGRSTTTTISKTSHVTIPPGKKVTASLMINLVENAEVPFTARIRRTCEGVTQEFTERGTWRGVVQFDSNIVITESDLV